MSVQSNPKNLTDLAVQRLAKRQPRTPKPSKTKRAPEGFPKAVRDAIEKRSGEICELDSCGRAQVIHHRRPRGNGGTSLGWVNQMANGLHLSHACHDRVEGRLPTWSREQSTAMGWLVPMGGERTAEQSPVLYRNRWVWLDNDGGVTQVEGDEL